MAANKPELVGVDVYMRYTDKEGKRWVQHRAIAGGRFVEITAEQYKADGGRAIQITREEFLKAGGGR